MKKILLLITLITVTACNSSSTKKEDIGCQSQSSQVAFSSNAESIYLHKAYIHVKHGSVEKVKNEIIEHSKIIRHEKPAYVSVSLWENDGEIYVYYPEGTTTYNFVNSISWLNRSPGKEHTGYAKGWTKSMGNGDSYYFYPDFSNDWGDTLLGIREGKEPVELYLPDARIAPTSKNVVFEPLPAVVKELGKPTCTFRIEVDVDQNFGNPLLEVTDKKDTNWILEK